jgi:DNA recombination protein RmuC
MDDILGLLFLIVGLIVGALTSFLIFRIRKNATATPNYASADPQIAALNENIKLKDQLLNENRSSLNELERKKDYEIDTLRKANVLLSQESSKLLEQVQSERRSSDEKMALLDEAQKKLSDAFKALSSEALSTNNKMFLDLAKENLEKYQEKARLEFEERQKNIDLIVKPLKESLEKVDVKISEMEKVRIDSYATLTEQVKSMATTQVKLQSETGNLVKAL